MENEPENETVEAVVLDSDNGQTLIADIPASESEEISDAVKITEIEAEKEIAIASIEADVETQRIEAETERAENWQEERLAALETNMTELKSLIMETLSSQPSPMNISEPDTEAATEAATELAETVAEEAAELLETAQEPSSIPQSTPDLTNEIPMELGANDAEENAAAVAVAVTAPIRKRRRLI